MASTNKPPTVNQDNFTNNLFSDLAPLLTLFGDEITKQFLATAMGLADDVLLGVAPIGIITVIVSAIRVSGSRTLRALIGRARDSPDDEEKELLSSTSTNVRELWDGYRVVRQTGESRTLELAYTPGPNWTVAHARESMQSTKDVPHWDMVNDSARAPNLTLNMPNSTPQTWTVLRTLMLAIVIQCAVIILNALGVYHWHWLRAGYVVASYGYPVWLAGTIALNIGVSICGRVVNTSTSKCTVNCGGQVVMFQKRNRDMNIPAYAIFLEDANVNASLRLWPRNPGATLDPDRAWKFDQSAWTSNVKRTEAARVFFTIFGTFVALSGFVCQNVGTRELHWSAGVLQLGATLMLSVLRASLRQHVGNFGSKTPQALVEGAEAAHLASHFAKASCYITGLPIRSDGTSIEGHWEYEVPPGELYQKLFRGPDDKHAQPIIDVRRILKTQILLKQFEPLEEQTANIASGIFKAMEEILDTLYGVGAHTYDRLRRHCWTQYMTIADYYENKCEEKSHPGLKHVVPLELPKPLGSIDAIQAILSLSCYRYRSVQRASGEFKGLHILGTSASGVPQDLEDWVGGRQRERIMEVNWSESGMPFGTFDEHQYPRELILVLGWANSSYFAQSVEPDGGPRTSDLVCQIATGSLEHSLAIEMISSFMLGLALHDRENGNALQNFRQNQCGPSSYERYDVLADILLKHEVCCDRRSARIAIVPAYMACATPAPDDESSEQDDRAPSPTYPEGVLSVRNWTSADV